MQGPTVPFSFSVPCELSEKKSYLTLDASTVHPLSACMREMAEKANKLGNSFLRQAGDRVECLSDNPDVRHYIVQLFSI